MRHLFVKDKKVRKEYLKKEKKRILLKFLLQNYNINIKSKFFLSKKLEKIKLSSVTKIRNRCVLTYRTRSINQQHKMARTSFRTLLGLGLVPGYKKAIW